MKSKLIDWVCRVCRRAGPSIVTSYALRVRVREDGMFFLSAHPAGLDRIVELGLPRRAVVELIDTLNAMLEEKADEQ